MIVRDYANRTRDHMTIMHMSYNIASWLLHLCLHSYLSNKKNPLVTTIGTMIIIIVAIFVKVMKLSSSALLNEVYKVIASEVLEILVCR